MLKTTQEDLQEDMEISGEQGFSLNQNSQNDLELQEGNQRNNESPQTYLNIQTSSGQVEQVSSKNKIGNSKSIDMKKNIYKNQKIPSNKISYQKPNMQRTFSPNSLRNQQKGQDSLMRSRSKSPIADRLFEYKREIEMKKSLKKQQIEQDRLKECTFSPQTKNNKQTYQSTSEAIKNFLDRQKYHKEKQQEKFQNQIESPKEENKQVKLLSKGSQKILAEKEQFQTPVYQRLYSIKNQTSKVEETEQTNQDQFFTPRITQKAQMIKRQKSIDTILYEDAKRRREHSPEEQIVNQFTISEASKRLLRCKIEQEANSLYDKYVPYSNNGKINYFGLKRIMIEMYFFEDHKNTPKFQKEENLLKVM